ncbi:hypothetical protein J6590_011695 [Homalodisca vitripennis]|nr:hypothetical protein J6590_011695 [Homalodisca vitripennis]
MLLRTGEVYRHRHVQHKWVLDPCWRVLTVTSAGNRPEAGKEASRNGSHLTFRARLKEREGGRGVLRQEKEQKKMPQELFLVFNESPRISIS